MPYCRDGKKEKEKESSMFDDVSVGKECQEVEEEDSWKEEGRKEGRKSVDGGARLSDM